MQRKTLKIPIEQKETFAKVWQIYLQAFQLAYSGYSYKELRKKFPQFSSQLVNNARYDATKLRKQILKSHNYPKKRVEPNPLLRKEDIRLDWENEQATIIYKPYNRIHFEIYPSEKQLHEINRNNVKGARLVRKKRFKLHLVLEKNIEISRWEDTETLIGIDLGLNYIAVCCTFAGEKFGNPLFFKGGEWKHLCRRQKNCNPTKWKHLQNRKEEMLHTISKRIVEYAKKCNKPLIVLEKINLRNTRSWSKWNNFLLNNWARSKLQRYIEYKANWEGIPVVYVNPYNTSKLCCYCGTKGKRDAKNFYCPQCGRQLNADFNASVNIAKRFRQILNKLTSDDRESLSVGSNAHREGHTYLPQQTHTQPENANQMNMMNICEGEVGFGDGRC